MMLCSGGGGRTDYGALRYFTEFWPSDNTDPLERIFIQWGYSHFFPLKSMCAHVTNWNRSTSIKFRTDVAMMCKLGFDIIVKDLPDDELQFCRQALRNYNRLKHTILDGDFYRLVSPYEGQHAAMQTVSADRTGSGSLRLRPQSALRGAAAAVPADRTGPRSALPHPRNKPHAGAECRVSSTTTAS